MGYLQDFIAKNGGYFLSQFVNFKLDLLRLIKYYNEYRNRIHLSFKDQNNIQIKALKALLIHAEDKVPYYSKLFRKYGFDPYTVTSIDDIKILPPLKRVHLQNQLCDLTATEYLNKNKTILNKTGGSTGTPVSLYQDIDYKLRGKAAAMVFDSIAGWCPGCRTAVLWGSERDLKVAATLKGRIHTYFTNYRHYNAYYMSADNMLQYYRDMQKFKPDVILGYAESLNMFAEFLTSKGFLPCFPRKSIISSAGTLFPDMRDNIQKAFGVPVFNRYGAREVGLIASTLDQRKGLHINTFDQIVELERSKEDSSIYNILVTNLRNYATPLIRYRIGDTSTGWINNYSRNYSMPVLKDISGRISSIIRTPSGEYIYGGFRQLISSFSGIASYQFVQNDLYNYILYIVPKTEISANNILNIKDIVLKKVGNECKVNVKIVKSIPLTSSGKHLYTISKITSNRFD